MHKKNYQAIVDDICFVRSEVKRGRYDLDGLAILDLLTERFCDTFKKDNPRFSRELFLKAVKAKG